MTSPIRLAVCRCPARALLLCAILIIAFCRATPSARAQSVPARSAASIRLAAYGGDVLHDFDDLNVVLDSVTVRPDPIPGGVTAVGTVKLRFPLFRDVVVLLSNTNPAVTIPDQVTVRALDKTATFPVTARAVTGVTTGKIGGMIELEDRVTQAGGKLSVRPAGVLAVTLSPARVRGGQFSSGVVTLEAPLASGPATVTLTVSSPIAELGKTTLVIPMGETLAAFTVETHGVSAETPVTVTACVNGVTQSGLLVVSP